MNRRLKALPPWASATCQKPERGGFAQVGKTLLTAKPFKELQAGARHLYICMILESQGKDSFTFPEKRFKEYGLASRTARMYIEKLIQKGFITCTCSGKNTRTPSVYKFVCTWKHEL